MPCKHFRSLSGTGPRVPGRWTGSSDSIRFHNASSISHGFAMTVQRANGVPRTFRTADPYRIFTRKDGITWQGNTGSSLLSSVKRQPAWSWKLPGLSLTLPASSAAGTGKGEPRVANEVCFPFKGRGVLPGGSSLSDVYEFIDVEYATGSA